MPAPVYSAGSPGNVINGVSAAKSTNVAAFVDLSTAFEGQLSCQVDTLTTAPAAGTVFSAYKVYGGATPNTLSAAIAAGATSVGAASSAAIHPNQKIAIFSASTKVGEVVTATAAPSGSGPYAIPISATVNNYSAGDLIYLIAQSTPNVVGPMPSTGIAASTDYSASMTLGTGQWAVVAANTDTAQPVTVTVSLDKITAYQ